tara:strand:- start:19031 stop:19627 length:597 start_codon:yes stop_codon:yes gene_type:complete
MSEEMPKEIGVCRFVDGEYEVYPDSADIPPATKYTRLDPDDVVISRAELEGLRMGTPNPHGPTYTFGRNGLIDELLAKTKETVSATGAVRTLEDAENHEWDASKFIKMDIETVKQGGDVGEALEWLKTTPKHMGEGCGIPFRPKETIRAALTQAQEQQTAVRELAEFVKDVSACGIGRHEWADELLKTHATTIKKAEG